MEPDNLKQQALIYHSTAPAGKIAISVTKPTNAQKDLSLAYTPGVAEPVREIASDPKKAYEYTAKANLVAVITNGTAVLGLGNVGPLASKPVMEGKAVLFKRFAGIDVFDIEVDASDPEAVIDVVAKISPTFGGINLEDIKAPECFQIEQALIERLNIPVFHDDQHGTAIIVAAGLLNALDLQGKRLQDAKIVCLGAGAAGVSAMRLLLALGANKNNIFMLDRKGVITTSRQDLTIYKQEFAIETKDTTLSEVICDSDVFIGVSGPNLLTADMLQSMAKKPVVFALSNPDPEIHPSIVAATRKDVVLATGRSDFANQVNNVLCFPYIFRGALDVRAKKINQEMFIAAVHAVKDLAREPVPQQVLDAYQVKHLEFGIDYILPKPLDPRLLERVPAAVATAAIATKVAQATYPLHYPQIGDQRCAETR